MFLMTSLIFRYADLSKTQKPKYLENESLFLLQIKKCFHYTLRPIILQKIVF